MEDFLVLAIGSWRTSWDYWLYAMVFVKSDWSRHLFRARLDDVRTKQRYINTFFIAICESSFIHRNSWRCQWRTQRGVWRGVRENVFSRTKFFLWLYCGFPRRKTSECATQWRTREEEISPIRFKRNFRTSWSRSNNSTQSSSTIRPLYSKYIRENAWK